MKRFQLYEAPRDAIKKSGVKYVELMRSKDNSLCCGVSGMMNCNDMSKALRAFRLRYKIHDYPGVVGVK